MDMVELSRQRASLLHYQIAADQSPWAPYEFAVAAADASQLTVESCAAGATILDGSKANFDPEFKHIIHEDTGSLFEQAFLVAHEIGHALLGDGESEDRDSTIEIDATRSAEPSPLGVDRVVDYSRRQRREVQMDLFARELLLPRDWVKRLHLIDGMSCSDIANKMGARFDVVAQQLLDALLLPTITIQELLPQPEIPLNPKQRRAAQHRGNAFLLQAGPGTGKTRTLVARVEGLLDEGVDPRRILLLTFSNKAAAEMSDRIALKRPDAATSLWIGTFHGFGLDILRRFNDKCGLPSSPRLLDRIEAVDFIEEEMLRLGLTHFRNLYDPAELVADMLSAISRAKDEVVDADGYASLAQQMRQKASNDDEKAAAEKVTEIATVYKFYENIKGNLGAVDFGDLVLKPVLLLEQNEAVRLKLQDSYDHVLVDEYQDVNRSSIRLLSLLRPDGLNLWAVGDAKQSIYRFRGASSFNMSRFGQQDFHGGVTDSLETNYRSTPEIIKAINAFSQDMSAAGPSNSNLVANHASSGFTPELRTTADKSLISAAIAEAIQQHHKEGFQYRDQAVLVRGNSALATLAEELERLGIPVLFLGSLFERPEVRDLIALLTLLVDRRAMGLLRMANWPQFSMSMEDTVTAFDYLRESNAEARAWMSTSIPRLTADGNASIGCLRDALQGFDDTSNPWEVLAYFILDRTKTAAAIAKSTAVNERTKGMAIWQLMNFLRVQPAGQGLPIARMINRIRRLVHLRDERDLRQLPLAAQSIDAVRLMTIHGSKGLEFPVVHLAGCNQDTLPGSYQKNRSGCQHPDGMIEGAEGNVEQVERAAHAEEQECLFYVASSRAKDRLLFYAAKAAGNRSRQLSQFLNRLGNLCITDVVPQISLPLSSDQLPIKVSFSGSPRFSSEKISLYESCGRRFLYTHLLQVGGRRRMTSFTNMHDAVREVYKSVIDIANPDNHNCEALLDAAFIKFGLNDHGYAEDYRQIAKSMLDYFLESRAGADYQLPTALQVTFGNCHVEVWPDDIIVRDGKCTLRRVKTGHERSTDQDDINAAAFILAARRHFPHADIELVYLADEITIPLTITERKLSARQERLSNVLSNINAGLFKASQSEFTCPNCPAFFVCGSTPSGTLVKIF